MECCIRSCLELVHGGQVIMKTWGNRALLACTILIGSTLLLFLALFVFKKDTSNSTRALNISELVSLQNPDSLGPSLVLFGPEGDSLLAVDDRGMTTVWDIARSILRISESPMDKDKMQSDSKIPSTFPVKAWFSGHYLVISIYSSAVGPCIYAFSIKDNIFHDLFASDTTAPKTRKSSGIMPFDVNTHATLIALSDTDESVKVLSMPSFDQLSVLQVSNACSLEWDDSGTILAIGTTDGYVHLWDSVDDRIIFSTKPSSEMILIEKFLSNHYLIARVGDSIQYINVEKGTFTALDYKAPTKGASFIDVSPNGLYVATSNYNKGLVCVFELPSCRKVFKSNMNARTEKIAFTPDGTMLAILLVDKGIMMLSTESWRKLKLIDEYQASPSCFEFDHANNSIAVGYSSQSYKCKVYSMEYNLGENNGRTE